MDTWILLIVLSLVSASDAQVPYLRCTGKPIDIVFVLDSSSSIWFPDFTKQLEFVDDVISQFDIGPRADQTRIGVETFAHRTWLQFDLNKYTHIGQLRKSIKTILHKGGHRTETGKAIHFMSKHMFKSDAGSRQYANHIAVVITDGRSQEPHLTAAAAEEARRHGITLFAIGVGKKIDRSELRAIASDPIHEYVFLVDDYTALDSIKDKLAAFTCSEVTTSKPIVTTTEVPDVDPATALKICGGKPTDIYFILDSSSSIWEMDFKKQIQFVGDVVKLFDFVSNNTRIGVVTYSDQYETRIPLYNNQNKYQLLQQIKNIPYTSGLTNTADAIRYVREEGFAPSVSRPNVAHVIILLTDGVSREPRRTTQEAGLTHQAGIYVFAVGIGNDVDRDELNRIASDPDNSFVFHVSSFGLLNSIKNTLALKTCKITPEPQKVCFGDNSADVMFVFDSGNIGSRKTTLITTFINQIVRSLDYNTKSIRIGIMAENCPVNTDLDFSSPSKLSSHLSAWSYPTFRSLLQRVRNEGFAVRRGYALPVAIIFIDSDMDSRDLTEAAEEVMRLKYQGVEVYSVVIGNHLSSTLKMSFASHPIDLHYFSAPSYELLSIVTDQLLDILCDIMLFNLPPQIYPQ